MEDTPSPESLWLRFRERPIWRGGRGRGQQHSLTFPFLLSFLCFIKGKLCYLFVFF